MACQHHDDDLMVFSTLQYRVYELRVNTELGK